MKNTLRGTEVGLFPRLRIVVMRNIENADTALGSIQDIDVNSVAKRKNGEAVLTNRVILSANHSFFVYRRMYGSEETGT